jgi:hypothetical protein
LQGLVQVEAPAAAHPGRLNPYYSDAGFGYDIVWTLSGYSHRCLGSFLAARSRSVQD